MCYIDAKSVGFTESCFPFPFTAKPVSVLDSAWSLLVYALYVSTLINEQVILVYFSRVAPYVHICMYVQYNV